MIKLLWVLGDAAVREEATQLATAKELKLVDSTQPDAIFESIWVEQVFDPIIRNYQRKKIVESIVAIVFVNNNDFDSEGTIHRILRADEKISKVLFLYPASPSSNLLDGFTHFDEADVQHGVKGQVTLEALYEA